MNNLTDIQQFTASGKIVLRSVYKVPSIWLEPAPDPATGRFPNCVVEGNLTERQRDSGEVYISINDPLEVKDGMVLDLNDPYDKARWQAIEHSPLIAKTRYYKDERGNLVIDGNAKRYGYAEIYIEVPGNESAVKITKRKKQNAAETFIFNASENDIRQISKLLGSNMRHSDIHDVQEFLLDIAKREPDAIIDAFTGEDASLKLLLIDALERKIIYKKSNLYQYGEGIVLGTSQDSAILWMKDPRNKKLLDQLRFEVNPNWHDAPKFEAEVNEFAPIGSHAEVGAVKPVTPKNPSKSNTTPPSR